MQATDGDGHPAGSRFTDVTGEYHAAAHRACVDGRTITAVAPGKATIEVSAGSSSGAAVAYVMPPGILALASDALHVLDMGNDSIERVVDTASRCVSRHPGDERTLLEDLVAARVTGAAASRPGQTPSSPAAASTTEVDSDLQQSGGR